MSNTLEQIWNGWKLIEVSEALGGAEARHRQHLVTRRKRQLAVLSMLNETYPGLVRGEQGVSVPREVTQQWESRIQDADGVSVNEIRHKINFLALGLQRGQKALGWNVVVPAPMRLVCPESSPFTPMSFFELSGYRDWCRQVDEAIQSSAFHELLRLGNGRKGHRKLEPEMISWGLMLYLLITQDGLLGKKHLNSLPLSTATLATHGASTWLVLHEDVPDDMPGQVPPCTRLVLGGSALAVFMRHVDLFGHPAARARTYQQARQMTQVAWHQFCRAVGVDSLSLPACQKRAATAYRLHVPRYLVDSALGKHLGTDLSEARWQQLLLGGYIKHAEMEEDVVSYEAEIDTPLAGSQAVACSEELLVRDQPLYEARALLTTLRTWLYSSRDQKRRRFVVISRELEAAIASSQRMAPIAEWICRWLQHLHLKQKLKQSTLHTYLGTTLPLLQAMGNTPLDQDRFSALVEAYQYVVEQAKTEKNRHYRWTVLRGFHNFLVSELGLAQVQMEFVGIGVALTYHADANILSETEYQFVTERLKAIDPSMLGQIRYWIFVLGFRAGLRISEALSIQVSDVQLKKLVSNTDVVLLVRDNEYVGNKSYSSRRQLPLHHLLTEDELEPFKAFVINRQEMTRHHRVMLFGEGMESLAPLRDEKVSPAIHDVMRRVTGDPSVRFHHLRHSLANNLLLAFHGIPAPWAAPAHLEALWHNIMGGVATRQGLHFIAQVMGHSSPDVTLRSYLHCTGWLLGHYLHHEPHSVERARRPLPAVELGALAEPLGLTPARIRKWKQRYSERPAIWLGKAFTACPIVDVDDREPEPFPTLAGIQPVAHDRLHHLSLESLETLQDARQRYSSYDLERIFTLREGEVEQLMQAERRVLSLPTRRGSRARRHWRATKGKQHFDARTALPRLPRPHALSERRIANVLYRAIWGHWYEQAPDLLLEHLRYFYQYHRATEGHVWIREVDAGLAFVSWVLSLDQGVRATIEVTPSARSPLTTKQQVSEWRKRLPSQRHKVEWKVKPAGRRYAHELGTGNVALHVVNDAKSTFSVYPVRYVLVMACIVMTALQSVYRPAP